MFMCRRFTSLQQTRLVSSDADRSRRSRYAPMYEHYSTILEAFFPIGERAALATEAFLHGALHLALGGFAGDLSPLVVLPLAARDGELELDVTVLGVEPEGDEGLPVFLALAGEAGYLTFVEEELAVAGRVLGDVRSVLVGGDVRPYEEYLPVPHPRVALPEVSPAVPNRLHLWAGQRDAGLVGLLDVEVVEGLLVAREVRHRRFTTLSSARCISGRTSRSSTRIRSPTL